MGSHIFGFFGVRQFFIYAVTCDQALFFFPQGHTRREGKKITCDQAFFLYFFKFFFSTAHEARGKKITPSSRERHKGIIGRGHDLRLYLRLANVRECL